MDLELHGVVNHLKSKQTRAEYAFSSTYPRVVAAAGDLLVDYDTARRSIRATLRTSKQTDKVIYVGASRTFLAFLENGSITSYVETQAELRFCHERKIGGAGRAVTLCRGSLFGRHALFVKADSPSLWCVGIGVGNELEEPFKLRADMEGDQENANFIDGVFAKVRGRVATRGKDRVGSIVAIAIHPSLPVAAAAYKNGILRVWDVNRKEQRNYFDAQLLFGETVVQIDLHPHLPVLAICTTHGRILTFSIKSGIFKRGDPPGLASSKMRDRRRTFSAMCFTSGFPSYLLLLTSSRRIIVRVVSDANVLVNSTRFFQSSKVSIPVESTPLHGSSVIRNTSRASEDLSKFSLQWDPAVGFIACTLDLTGNVYIFQRKVDGLPAVNRPMSAGLDTGLSRSPGEALTGPVLVHPDTLIVSNNNLFLYQVGSERIVVLAALPHGDVRGLQIARDENGYCIGCLIFYCGDDEFDTRSYEKSGELLRYVLCTKRGDAEEWNVSEPAEGRSGCFLGESGAHDRIMILGNSGNVCSLFSFAGKKTSDGKRLPQQRGVQRFKLSGKRAAKVFRAPFAAWSAVVYHDFTDGRLTLSKNAENIHGSGRQDVQSSFDMYHEASVHLSEREAVLEVRWQDMEGLTQNGDYYGAVMTNKRIYFVRNMLQVYSSFEFRSIARMAAPLAPPSFSWMGPSLMLIHGDSLFSISVDGRADLVAGLSRGRNVSVIVAALPTRVVYATPSANDENSSISVVSRPYSGLSGSIRGVLSFPYQRSTDQSMKRLLNAHDISHGSLELSDALVRNNLASLAYLISTSRQSQHALPPLKRAAFLGRLGDIRGAEQIAENEYARLIGQEPLSEGTELYRFLQRLLNTAFATGDYAVGHRCSSLLGRKGTFAAFVDSEGGHAAVTSLVKAARAQHNRYLFEMTRPIIEKSARSSIATDSSLPTSPREVDEIRRSVRTKSMGSVSLGNVDRSRIFVVLKEEKDDGGDGVLISKVQLPDLSQREISDRLEMFRKKCDVQMPASETYNTIQNSDNATGSMSNTLQARSSAEIGAIEVVDSSDEDELFVTGQDSSYTGKDSDSLQASSTLVPTESGSITTQGHVSAGNPALQNPQQETTKVIVAQAQQAHALMLAQRQPLLAGQSIPESRASEIYERAVGKYSRARFSSSQKELDMALRSISREQQRGAAPSADLLKMIVFYQMACRIRIAMEEIATSAHANTLPGRITYSQLAAALSALPLGVGQRQEALILAADASLLLNNFGSAAERLRMVKELGIPQELRLSLRSKYSVCAAKGFLDTVSQPSSEICFMTLRGIELNGRRLQCTVCPAVFSLESGATGGSTCQCCGIGLVKII